MKTKSKATAVQVVAKAYGRIVDLKHIGSAHTPVQLDTLMALANKRLHQNQPGLFPSGSQGGFNFGFVRRHHFVF